MSIYGAVCSTGLNLLFTFLQIFLKHSSKLSLLAIWAPNNFPEVLFLTEEPPISDYVSVFLFHIVIRKPLKKFLGRILK